MYNSDKGREMPQVKHNKGPSLEFSLSIDGIQCRLRSGLYVIFKNFTDDELKELSRVYNRKFTKTEEANPFALVLMRPSGSYLNKLLQAADKMNAKFFYNNLDGNKLAFDFIEEAFRSNSIKAFYC